MKMTRILPTDKNGNVYYGPRTMKEAEDQIADGRPAKEIAQTMEDAGFVGIARKIRKEYDVWSEE